MAGSFVFRLQDGGAQIDAGNSGHNANTQSGNTGDQ